MSLNADASGSRTPSPSSSTPTTQFGINFGISPVTSPLTSTNGTPIGNNNNINNNSSNFLSANNIDPQRLTLDVSLLKKQYSKLKERQKQAQIILTGKSDRRNLCECN